MSGLSEGSVSERRRETDHESEKLIKHKAEERYGRERNRERAKEPEKMRNGKIKDRGRRMEVLVGRAGDSPGISSAHCALG